jgi:hypothetical protein
MPAEEIDALVAHGARTVREHARLAASARSVA